MSSISVLAAASEEVSGRDLLLPASYDLLWSAVCLIIIAYVIVKKVLPPFTKMLDERTERIEAGLTYADAAEERAREAAEEQRRIIDEARTDAAQARDAARVEAAAILAEAREAAKAETARIVENGVRQIEAERKTAAVALRAEVGELATELASKIVGESLADAARQSRVVDRFLDDLERSNHGAVSTVREN